MAAKTAPPAALLLLPTPTSPTSLRTRFAPTLASVLPSLADSVKNSDHVARLDVGITLPKTFSTRLSPRASVFSRVQELVEDLYALVSKVAAEKGVKLDESGGVDARVIMFEDQSGHPADRPQVAHSYSGPIVDLSLLVSSGRHYDPVFSVDSEDGENVLRQFLDRHGVHKMSHPNVHKIKAGEPEKASNQPIPELRKAKAMHKSVAVGGKLGKLSISDKILLTAAAVIVEPETDDTVSPTRRRITIGIIAGEGWDERQAKAADFFESIVAFSKHAKTSRAVERVNKPGQRGVSVQLGPTLTINYVEIADQGSLTNADESISALVISKGDGASIKGAKDLEVFEVDEIKAKQ